MEERGTPVGRRVVLGMVALGAAGVAVGAAAQDEVTKVSKKVAPGLGDVLPAAGGFRYYTVVDSDPVVTSAEYKLLVTGLARKTGELTFADLRAMPQTVLTKDFQCVTGWRVPGVRWTGVALPDLMDHVGVDPRATALKFTSLDGAYTESLTMAQARRRDMLVATSMLGGPISREHGGPVRLYTAPMYGYKSLKWLGGIEFTTKVTPGYWEVRGYDVDAWVGHSNGRDDVPT